MPRMCWVCQDCGRKRDFSRMAITPVYSYLSDGSAILDHIVLRCDHGCKPAPGGFWDRLGQSSLSDIFHRRLFRAQEVFDD